MNEEDIVRQQNQEKYEEAVNEYNQKMKFAPVKVLKGYAGSWIVLVLAIVTTVTVICSFLSLVTTFSSGWFKIISSLVKLTLCICLCVGFWRIFAMGRKKDNTLNSGGVRMLKGVITFYQVITYIVMILLIALVVAALITMKSCANEVENKGADVSEGETVFTGTIVGILVALVVVFIVFIFYYSKTIGFTKALISDIDNKDILHNSFIAAAVMFFIVGGVDLLTAIVPVALSSTLNSLLKQLGSSLGFLSSLGNLFKLDVADLLASLAKALTYIFGGILAVSYRGLPEKVQAERRSLEKPVKPN